MTSARARARARQCQLRVLRCKMRHATCNERIRLATSAKPWNRARPAGPWWMQTTNWKGPALFGRRKTDAR
eukprot:13116595-Alexandrium_andersonii.AAC.1